MSFKERLFLALAPYAPMWWYLGSCVSILAFCAMWWFWAYAPLRNEYRSRAMICREVGAEQTAHTSCTPQSTTHETPTSKPCASHNGITQLAEYMIQSEAGSSCKLESVDLNEAQKTCTFILLGPLSTILDRITPAPCALSVAIQTLSCTRHDDASVRMHIQYAIK